MRHQSSPKLRYAHFIDQCNIMREGIRCARRFFRASQEILLQEGNNPILISQYRRIPLCFWCASNFRAQGCPVSRICRAVH